MTCISPGASRIARRDDRGYWVYRREQRREARHWPGSPLGSAEGRRHAPRMERQAVIVWVRRDNHPVPDEGRAHGRQVTLRRFGSNAEADQHDSNTGGKSHLRIVYRTHGVCPSNNGNSRATPLMNPDFVDLLRALRDADARFLIVGAYTLAHFGRPRATGNLDIWVEASAPMPRYARSGGLRGTASKSRKRFSRPGVDFQIDVPPGRIDLLTELTALTFDESWSLASRGSSGSSSWTASVARRSSATSAQPAAPRIRGHRRSLKPVSAPDWRRQLGCCEASAFSR